MFEPNIWFITPVHKRQALTAICLEQRKRMIDALPFEAHAVIVGDDVETIELAESLGFDTVLEDNRYLGAKFNAGYQRAQVMGATHCMPIGSDSWLHPSTFEGVEWTERGGFSTIGLSSISSDGLQRIDLVIKYPAGFGVGMLYPSWCLGDAPAERTKQRGVDTSTWMRCGKGRIQLDFLELVPFSYVNFHSPDVQVTDFKDLLAGHHMRSGFKRDKGLEDLRGMYDDDLLDRIEGYYAAHSIGIFLRGERPVLETTGTRTSSNTSAVLLKRARVLSGNMQLSRIEDLSEEFRALLGV